MAVDNAPASALIGNQRIQDDVYLDVCDVAFAAEAARTDAAREIAAIFGIDDDRASHMRTSRSPDILPQHIGSSVKSRSARFGRVQLPFAGLNTTATSRPYALARPTRVLLERLAAAVSHAEPVLLTGETGTGKTAAVAELARRVGKTLVALNLSQQTDAADLFGGFRPIDLETESTSMSGL